jgi:zinc transport system substrate-binding protein
MLNLYQLRIYCRVRKIFYLLILVVFTSCGGGGGVKDSEAGERIITVSIVPFRYFVEAIAGDDFAVNVMVPSGSNPHIYEPFPEQVFKLRKSIAYISNGYLGFEITWLGRFYNTNRTMKKLALNQNIQPLVSAHRHDGEHEEGADPHYWVSPKCAMIMAASVKDFLVELNPGSKNKYETNYNNLLSVISGVDKKASDLFSGVKSKNFMIYHPNLGYLARDYGLEEIAVEFEGKEPTPSRMKELIDRSRACRIKTIFVQREYDAKNARELAHEIGAKVQIIDPLSGDWPGATTEIINALYESLSESSK